MASYSDLKPLCKATPASEDGDINIQAASLLKAMTGEQASFNIEMGIDFTNCKVYVPRYYNYGWKTQTVHCLPYQSWPSSNGAAITTNVLKVQSSLVDGTKYLLYAISSTVVDDGYGDSVCVYYDTSDKKVHIGYLSGYTIRKFTGGSYVNWGTGTVYKYGSLLVDDPCRNFIGSFNTMGYGESTWEYTVNDAYFSGYVTPVTVDIKRTGMIYDVGIDFVTGRNGVSLYTLFTPYPVCDGSVNWL